MNIVATAEKIQIGGLAIWLYDYDVSSMVDGVCVTKIVIYPPCIIPIKVEFYFRITTG